MMKKIRSVITLFVILCMTASLVIPVGANSFSSDGTVTINDGVYVINSEGERYDVRSILKCYYPIFTNNDPITFNLNTEFSKPTTTYSDTVARLSCAISAIVMANNKRNIYPSMLAAMWQGKEYTHTYINPEDETINADFPNCATGEYVSTTSIMRNGHECKLILVSFDETTKGDYSTSISDLLLYDEKTAGLQGDALEAKKEEIFSGGKLYSITEAADFAAEGIDAYIPEDGDYLFWLVGGMRGGAIANDLASQLIDRYGTQHVVAYTFGSMHTSTFALDCDQTSKYDSIFCIANTDDAIAQLALGVEYDPGWGFKRWGTTIKLGFPDVTEQNKTTLDVTTTDFYKALNASFKHYALEEKTGLFNKTDYYGNVYPPYNYSVYRPSVYNGIPNGGSVGEFMAAMKQMLPSLHDYYDNELTLNTGKKTFSDKLKTKTVDSLYAYLKGYISLLSDSDDNTVFAASIFSLLGELMYSADYDCDVHYMLKFGLNHGLHENSAVSLLGGMLPTILNGFKLPIHEAVTATLPEAYMAWMGINSYGYTARDGFLTELPEDADTTKDSLTSNGVTVSGEKAFYFDQGFTAKETENGYQLSFGYTSGASLEKGKTLTACDPYGEVTLSVPAPFGVTKDITAYFNGEPVEMTYQDGMLSAKILQLNGELVFPVVVTTDDDVITVKIAPDHAPISSTRTALLASYDANGKMTVVFTKELTHGKADFESKNCFEAGEETWLYLLDSNWEPTYEAVLISDLLS